MDASTDMAADTLTNIPTIMRHPVATAGHDAASDDLISFRLPGRLSSRFPGRLPGR
jgi:hypothetical protein